MITKNYIKMCEKAEEIQKAWKPVDWDRFIYKDDREFGIACVDGEPMNKKTMKEINKKYIWLPTQEQLQEMIDWIDIIKKSFCNQMWKKNYQIGVMLIELIDFYKLAINRQDNLIELWFAFVMHEKWNKEWDGNKWK